MIFYYLDASAWVKRYYAEAGTVWLQDLFAQNPVFACATLGLVEVVATFSRKQKSGQISRSTFQQVSQTIEADWQNFIQVQFAIEVLNQAKQITGSLALRGADSIHLASAVILQSRLLQGDQIIFITADGELEAAAQSCSFHVLNPSVEEAKGTP
ncbi:type II toxin-antitoxin system VapC family toxin [Leptolyngbya sp. NIES-2104]|uniref:type II toxin-antitoxin system VapC family toxin n=1 Tax=Leptolyngbya sp. NIES-2104 TaxID=1552121 RepID=UPI0006EC9015|nr:type II toxin-antitoxin system VapC family toxin [Leptolyngbya sp. NIES-2104]GAP93571.1 hypothetical protein NIES2104_00770 [Leptolyngbya sp. NIES-2104]